MGKSLVIVESPAKSKTLLRYLGKDYQVLASNGHVRDLLPKTGAVDTENNFEMKGINKKSGLSSMVTKASQYQDSALKVVKANKERIGRAVLKPLREKERVERTINPSTIEEDVSNFNFSRVVNTEIAKSINIDSINE